MSEITPALTGWYEFIHPDKRTTHIAYIGEYGRIYIPEQDITVDIFFRAMMSGQAFRLVREQE